MRYPNLLKDQMAGLEDLLFKASAEELDERGCLSTEVCKEIDRRALKWAEAKLKGFYMPIEVGHGSDPNNKWRTASCLQKAIRGGDPEMAMFAVSALFDMDASYALRRLGTIAVEDVLIGNLPVVMATLAAMGDVKWRKAVDERRLLIWLAKELASGAKDRASVSLIVGSTMTSQTLLDGCCKMTNEQLAEILDDAESPDLAKQVAALAMAGTKRFPVDGMSETNDRPATALFKFMADDSMCKALLWLAARTASRLHDAMFATLLMVDRWLRADKTMQEIESDVGPRPKVGLLLGAAYDRYTREGQAAISKFFRDCPALKPFVEATPGHHPQREMAFRAVFLAEGGVLNRRAAYGGGRSEIVYGLVNDPVNRFSHLPPELSAQLLTTVRANLGFLNECRSKVLYAKLKK